MTSENLRTALLSNLFSYDWIIFVVFAVGIVVCFRTVMLMILLKEKLHPNLTFPDNNSMKSEGRLFNNLQYTKDIIKLRTKEEFWYSVFVNITGIFPLLGILGTVLSLLRLIGDVQNVTANFYGALTSTSWGLVFAIIFKSIDGLISARIEDNDKHATLYLEAKYSKEKSHEK